MVRYDGLEHGRKIREFSSKLKAEAWKKSYPQKGRIGKYKGRRIYTIRKTR